MPRIFVPVPSEALWYVGSIMETGAEPMVLGLPMDLPIGGVALRREWIADWAEVFCSSNELDALLLSAAEPAELAGLLIAALRLDLPAVVVPTEDPFSVALAALGFAPLDGDAAEIAVELARTGRPRPREPRGCRLLPFRGQRSRWAHRPSRRRSARYHDRDGPAQGEPTVPGPGPASGRLAPGLRPGSGFGYRDRLPGGRRGNGDLR